MKRLLLLTLLFCGCAEDKATYNLQTLKSDISSLPADRQAQLVRFSTTFEQSKDFQDSVLGVPVVLVPSLTYTEILEYIDAERRRLFASDSSRYAKISTMAVQRTTEDLNGISFERWTIDNNFLEQSGLMLVEGRNFSTAFNDDMNVLISEPLADRLGLGIGDSIELASKVRIIGVFENLPTSYPTTTHYLVCEPQKK